MPFHLSLAPGWGMQLKHRTETEDKDKNMKVYLTTSYTAYRTYEVEIPDNIDTKDPNAVYQAVATAKRKHLKKYDDVDVDEESVDIKDNPSHMEGNTLWSEEEVD